MMCKHTYVRLTQDWPKDVDWCCRCGSVRVLRRKILNGKYVGRFEYRKPQNTKELVPSHNK